MSGGMHRHRNQLCLSALLALGTLIGSTAQTTAQDDGAATAGPESAKSEITTQLPPADLPTMNEQGYVFELESTFTGSLTSAPTEAPVYSMTLSQPDQEQAAAIAEELGLEGEIQQTGEGTFTVSGNGDLYVSPGLVQYISAAEVPEGELPNDEQAVAFAREWLRQTGLLAANIGEGEVQARVENPGRVIVLFKPIEPANLMSSSPGITVTMGANGTILESSIRWAEITEGDTYQLRPADNAWQEVVERRSYLQTTLPSDQFPDGSTITGTAEYTDVSIAYTSSGVPGEQQYLQPVFVFTGQITPEGSDQSYPITAYVPGLINSQQPVG